MIEQLFGVKKYIWEEWVMVKSKLVPAILIGAVAGAIVSMFDKATREHTVETTKKVKETVTYYSQNSDELVRLVETKVEQAQTFYNSSQQNFNSLLEKVDDAKTLPATVMSLVAETKDAFSNNESK